MESRPDRRLPRRPPALHPVGLSLTLAAVMLAVLVFVIWLRGEPWIDPTLERAGISPGPGLAGWDEREWALWAFQVVTILPFVHAARALGEHGTVRLMRAAASVVVSGGLLTALLVALQVGEVSRSALGADYLLLLAAVPLTIWGLGNRWRRAWLRPGKLRVVELMGPDDAPAVSSTDIRRVVTALRLGTSDEDALAAAAPSDTWPEALDWSPERLAEALNVTMVEEIAVRPEILARHASVIYAYAEEHGIDVVLVVPGIEVPALARPHDWSGNLALNLRSLPQRHLSWSFKRAMDVVGAVVGLVLFAPVLLLGLVALKIEDPHLPLFYRGRRVGLKGHKFRMWKINTMVRDANAMEADMQEGNEREGPWFKVDSGNDPRLTKVGRFLRKYSLNEIPQFWNILVGDMSLVGPRPPTPDEVETYIQYDSRYFHCLDVKPGLTGLWQVKAKDDPSFDRRIELDVQYIRNWSIWLDIKLLFLTFWSVVSKPET